MKTTVPVDDLDDLDGLGPRLLVLDDGRVTVHALPSSGALYIGRGAQMDIQIDRDSISRRHAVLHLGERIEVEDVGSSNGTRVGGIRIEPGRCMTLAPGDLIELGKVCIVVQGPVEAPSRRDGQTSMDRLGALAERVARSDISVLLLGETGVGKEVFARRLHDLSQRKNAPFVPLHCGALSETLLESELFGHEQGAFTGAHQTKPGLLETAERGTVFLDEVGEMPLAAQVKLLRVLEERRVLRVGGLQSRPIDVRFVAATHRDLREEVRTGRFREDLYYRLNGIALTIPPLRDRVVEIAALAETFIASAAARAGVSPPLLSRAALGRLEVHAWPGNVRELRNVVERASVLCGDGPIEPEHLFDEPSPSMLIEPGGLDERARIMHALQQCAGNQTRAAELLDMSRKTLGHKMDKHGIARPQKRRN